MDKINFVNSQSPYLSADNLNQMQDNVENAFNNEYIEETTETYSADYINNCNIYSTTEEIFTGETWIDGKPIYQKVLTALNLGPNGVTDRTIAPGETLDTAWCDGGFIHYLSNNYRYPFDGNNGIAIQVSAQLNNVIFINRNTNDRTFDFYAIIKYTKANEEE